MEETIIVLEEIDEEEINVEEENFIIGVFPSGTIDITTNGEHDITNYESANVNVTTQMQEKSINIGTNGALVITPDSGYDGLTQVDIITNVQPNLQSKDISVETNGTSSIIADSNYDGLDVVTITTNVQPTLQNKVISLTENGTTNIEADTGYDGLDNVSITVNVSAGGGFPPDWNEIGYIETPLKIIRGFNLAKEIKDNWDISKTSLASAYTYNYDLLFFPVVDTSNVTNMNTCFRGSNLIKCPSLNTSQCSNFSNIFRDCIALEEVGNLDMSNNTSSLNYAFSTCRSLKKIPAFNWEKTTQIQNVFQNDGNLEDESLNNIILSLATVTLFSGTKTLKYATGLNSAACQKMAIFSAWAILEARGWTTGY